MCTCVLTPPLHTWCPPVLGLPRPCLRPPHAPRTLGWAGRLLCSGSWGAPSTRAPGAATRSSPWASDTPRTQGHSPHVLPGCTLLPGEGGPAQCPGSRDGAWMRCSAPTPSGLPHRVSARLCPVASLVGRRPPATSSRGRPARCGSPGVSCNKAGRVGPGPTLIASSDLSHLQVQPPWGQGSLWTWGPQPLTPPGPDAAAHRHLLPWLQPHCWPLPAPLAEDSSPGAGVPPAALAVPRLLVCSGRLLRG